MISKEFIKSLMGLAEKTAVETIKNAGFRARIRSRDGESFAGTCDYRLDRVNLYITDDKVKNASVG